MKKNVGKVDRIVRLLIVILIAVLYFGGFVNGVLATILLVAGGIFLLTSVVGSCGIYSLVGLNTCRIDKKEK